MIFSSINSNSYMECFTKAMKESAVYWANPKLFTWVEFHTNIQSYCYALTVNGSNFDTLLQELDK